MKSEMNKVIDLYADNLKTLVENIITVGGNPMIVFERYSELLKTLSANGIRLKCEIEEME
jgi:organic radical activating enzyme